MASMLHREVATPDSIREIVDRNDEQSSLAKKILLWVAHAREPFTVAMLRHALAIDPETGSFTLPRDLRLTVICRGLIVVDEKTTEVGFTDEASKEYVRSTTSRILGALGHTTIAEACIAYLLHAGIAKLKLGGCHGEGGHMPFDSTDNQILCTGHLQEFLNQSSFPLLRYAFEHWGHHVQEASGENGLPKGVIPFLREFGHFPLLPTLDIKYAPTSCQQVELGTPLHVAAQYGLCDLLNIFPLSDDTTVPHNQLAVHLAALHGQEQFLSAILPHQDPNSMDGRGRTPFSNAAASGHSSCMRLLLYHGVVLKDADDDGYTPLMRAAYGGHREAVQAIMDLSIPCGSKFPAKPKKGEMALHLAARNNHPDVVKVLLGYPKKQLRTVGLVDPKSKDNKGRTALMEAARCGATEIVRMLVEYGDVDPNAVNNHKQTALMIAAERGDEQIVRFILQHPRTKVNYLYGGALRTAVAHGHRRCVLALLESDHLDVSIADQQGETALHKAASKRDDSISIDSNTLVDIVKDLLPHSDVNARDKFMSTPLMKAADWGQHRIIQALFVMEGIDVNARDRREQTALIRAAFHGQESAVFTLLSHPGVDVLARDRTGRSALRYATWHKHQAIVDLLLKPRSNFETNSDRSLDNAILQGCLDSVKELLARPDADSLVNRRNERGTTPLILAVEFGNPDIVSALLEHPAIDVNQKSDRGETALMRAIVKEGGGRLGEKGEASADDGSCEEEGAQGPVVSEGEAPVKIVQQLLSREDVNVNAGDQYSVTPLMRAASLGLRDAVELLLERGADVTMVEANGMGVFAWAAEGGSVDIIRRILFYPDVDILTCDGRGDNALLKAALRGHTDAVEFLVSEGFDVNDTNNIGETPLHRAAVRGHGECISALLELGANANAVDQYQNTPLTKAAERGQPRSVEALLQHPDVDVNAKTKKGATALAFAAGGENEHLRAEGKPLGLKEDRSGEYDEVVQLLLAHLDVEVDSRDVLGRTPLMKAAHTGRQKAARLLLAHEKCNPNAQHDRGATPLMMAAMGGHRGMVKLLLSDSRVDPNTRDIDGRTALAKAILRDREETAMQLITNLGVDVNLKDKRGHTPLMHASSSGLTSVVHTLIAHPDIQLNAKDHQGETAFMKAANRDCREVVQVLLSLEGVETDARDNLGSSALMKAAANGHNIVIEGLLKDRRIDADAGDKNGDTALMKAAAAGRDTTVFTLLRSGKVDVNRANEEGETSLMKAARAGEVSCVRLLLYDVRDGVDLRDGKGETALMKAAAEGRMEVVELLLDAGADIGVVDKCGEMVLDKVKSGSDVCRLLHSR